MEDSGEVLDDSSSSPSSTLKSYPLTCKVLYSYKVRGASPRNTELWHLHRLNLGPAGSKHGFRFGSSGVKNGEAPQRSPRVCWSS